MTSNGANWSEDIHSLHRDCSLAKVPGQVPGASSGNAYSLNCRAVMCKASAQYYRDFQRTKQEFGSRQTHAFSNISSIVIIILYNYISIDNKMTSKLWTKKTQPVILIT